MEDPSKPGGSILMAGFLIGLIALGLAVSLMAPFGAVEGQAHGHEPAHPAHEAGH